MHRELVLGSLLLTGGLVGYVLGVVRPFPGRELTIPSIMLGLLLVSIGRTTRDGVQS